MKKNYLVVILALVCNFAMAQIQSTTYKGAFAPAPAAMWTAGWTNFDPQNAVYGTTNVQVSADVTSNTTWTKNNVYQLNGLITVRNGATLTIQAGTVIRSSQVASALLIARGSKLIANGTAAEPIVFTSNKAINSRARGDWGGIVMLGRARYNINNGVNYIEGLTQNPITEFGGGTTPDNNDNSGILRFVRIEYAGFVFSPNNELNGLTMGAVGKGTVIENVQVSYSNDDSFEWFGGSVNCKNLVAFAGLDDDFDVDNGFTGVVQFGLSVKDPVAADISTSEIFEVDNNSTGADTAGANAWADFTSPIFSNITCIGANARPGATVAALHDKALRLRRASRANIYNSIFLDSRRGLSIESTSSNTAYNATTPTAIFKNNTIASPIPLVPDVTPFAGAAGANAATQTWFSTSSNVTITTGSTGILTRPYNATSATNYNLIADNNDTTGIDYRPASTDARTGADFTDNKLSGLVAVGNAPRVTPAILDYCKGVVAPAFVVNLTSTGVSLRWYTKPVTFKLLTQVGGKDIIALNPDGSGNQIITVVDGADILTPVTTDTFFTTAPVVATTIVGTKYFYVAEVDAAGAVSARAQIRVNTLTSPTVALGAITSTVGGVAATAAVGPYINTATQVTYTVTASTEVGVVDYLWTVPTGANIISGQGTNTIVVNYLNVPGGILKVGNVSVQARNASLCGGAIKTLAITAALPAAPAVIVLNDGSTRTNATTGLVSNVAITSFAKYMGTTTPLTVVTTPVVGAQSYVWELPAGVNITTQTTVASDVTRFYNLFPFLAISALTTAPSTAGNVFYEIRTITYTDGTSVATGKLRQNARNAVGTVGTVGYIPAITARNETLTNLTNEGVAINPAYPILRSTSNVLNVNFAGVTSGTTHNYMTTAAVPVSTNVMRIGVKSISGVGASVTPNTTAINPATTSTAKLLTLTAVLPAAPAAIKMTNDAVSTSTAVTVISKFVGTTTPFTLTATPSLLASSYSWELPNGVNLVSAPSSLSTNVITVNFAGVAPATTALYIGVKAINGIGSSITSTNGTQVPATSSTARLLKLTATVPGAVTIVTGIVTGLCGNSSYNYTITPSLLANSYSITAPAGAVVTSASNMTNTSNVLATSDLMFTVMYPAGFVVTTAAPKSLMVSAVNGIGTSLLPKTLALSTVLPALGTITSTTGTITSFNQTLTAKVFTVPTNVLFTGYTWTASNGAVITAGQGTNTITVNFSAVVGTLSTTSSIITVVGTNACNSSAVKSTTLKYNATASRLSQETEVNATEVYPNPVLTDFNIDVKATTAGVLEIAIYSLDGTLVVSPKSVELQAGLNTITENVSSLKSGIYVVQLVNSSNNEVITKKLIKN